jgi:3-hydroxybutyrate dehydrogenase
MNFTSDTVCIVCMLSTPVLCVLLSCNVVCPGFVLTDLVRRQIPEQAASLGLTEEEVVKNIMLAHTVDTEFTTIEDVAETVLFLASRRTNAITSEEISVSHGW